MKRLVIFPFFVKLSFLVTIVLLTSFLITIIIGHITQREPIRQLDLVVLNLAMQDGRMSHKCYYEHYGSYCTNSTQWGKTIYYYQYADNMTYLTMSPPHLRLGDIVSAYGKWYHVQRGGGQVAMYWIFVWKNPTADAIVWGSNGGVDLMSEISTFSIRYK